MMLTKDRLIGRKRKGIVGHHTILGGVQRVHDSGQEVTFRQSPEPVESFEESEVTDTTVPPLTFNNVQPTLEQDSEAPTGETNLKVTLEAAKKVLKQTVIIWLSKFSTH